MGGDRRYRLSQEHFEARPTTDGPLDACRGGGKFRAWGGVAGAPSPLPPGKITPLPPFTQKKFCVEIAPPPKGIPPSKPDPASTHPWNEWYDAHTFSPGQNLCFFPVCEMDDQSSGGQSTDTTDPADDAVSVAVVDSGVKVLCILAPRDLQVSMRAVSHHATSDKNSGTAQSDRKTRSGTFGNCGCGPLSPSLKVRASCSVLENLVLCPCMPFCVVNRCGGLQQMASHGAGRGTCIHGEHGILFHMAIAHCRKSGALP